VPAKSNNLQNGLGLLRIDMEKFEKERKYLFKGKKNNTKRKRYLSGLSKILLILAQRDISL